MKLSNRILNNPDAGSYNHRKAVTVLDASSSSLPTTLLVDGVLLQEDDRVLFTALSDSSKNNRVYAARKGSLVLVQDGLDSTGMAEPGDVVFVKQGSHSEELWGYEGTSWQILDVDIDTSDDGSGGGGGGTWGSITGSLAAQTDLQSALDDKLDLAGGVMSGNINMESVGSGAPTTVIGMFGGSSGGVSTYNFAPMPPTTMSVPIQVKDGTDTLLGTITLHPTLFILQYTPEPGSALPALTNIGGLPLFALGTGVGLTFLSLSFSDTYVFPIPFKVSFTGGPVTTNSRVLGLADGVAPRDAVNKQQLDSAVIAITPAVVQTIYVDKNYPGTYAANGSQSKPYKSLEEMYNAVADASASKKYCCIIAPGTYNEVDTIRIKPHIDLTCLANDTVLINVAGGATLKWSNANPGRTFFSNIGIGVGLEILNDNPSGTSGCVLDLDNVQVASIVFNGRGGGKDYLQLRNDTLVQGACTINSAATTIYDSTVIGTLTMTDVGCVFPDSYGSAITATLRSNYELNVVINNSSYDVYVDAWGNNPISSLSITSNSAYPSTFNADASSYPNSITLSGSPSPVVQRTSTAPGLGYTPGTSANWAAPAPKTVQQALDRMAALLKTLNSNNPIP